MIMNNEVFTRYSVRRLKEIQELLSKIANKLFEQRIRNIDHDLICIYLKRLAKYFVVRGNTLYLKKLFEYRELEKFAYYIGRLNSKLLFIIQHYDYFISKYSKRNKTNNRYEFDGDIMIAKRVNISKIYGAENKSKSKETIICVEDFK